MGRGRGGIIEIQNTNIILKTTVRQAWLRHSSPTKVAFLY